MRAASYLSLAMLLPIAACVAPSADAGLKPRSISAVSLAGNSSEPGTWPRQDWWRAYGDPQLDTLIAEALVGSPDVAAAEARLHKAQALAGQARSALLPSITANGSAALTKQSYNNGFPAQFVPQGYNDTGRATLDFSYELDFWGRNRAAVAAATSDIRASEADRAAAVLMLSTSIASTYAQLAQLQAERDVAAASITLRSETLKLVRQRVLGGLDTGGEERSAEANVAAAQESLASTDESIAITRNALAALTGAGPDRAQVIVAPANVHLAAFGLPPRIDAELIGRKPEIVAARWRADAAGKRIHVARASFYPNVNLAAFIGFQSLGLSNLLASGSDIGQVGPAISLPIFDGGRLKSNLRGAEADYALAVSQYDSALVRALQDVADATASGRALTGRLTDARAALAAQEDAYRIARLRYTGGLADYQSVLIAEDTVLQRRRLVADLQARAFTLDVALVRALGGGFAAPVALAAKEVP